MEKSYRIHTNVGSDTVLNVNMSQDFDFLEVLSLKLRQKDAYKLHSSSYGVIVGRVLANDAFGIPNAKVSVFIERDDNDSVDMANIYPYTDITSQDSEGRRYNLLQDYSDDSCYRVVGTFPNKRYLLDYNTMLEVFDKYWKYTTVTNQAGDYMIFGVPTGSQQLHVDIDLSDIGVLSQKPRDFEYKGYNLSMFDSPVQFKESTNLDNLAQLLSQNKSVNVYPFWGDDDNGIAAITRSDIQVQYKFEPTCVFMGSIISDNDANSIGHKCAPSTGNGMNSQLIGGNGTIEMIRKTTDGLVEEYQIQGNQLIDENGVWCYQIPMNLDYIGTDEYGNVVPTDNPSKGIPTRTQVRFRISKTESGDEGFSRHTAKYLVPMNPPLDESSEVPKLLETGVEAEKMYNFGSSTPESCFRDLYWNNVYSVKNYIPKSQVAHRAYSNNYTALKGSNIVDNQNPVPFNKLRIDMPFSYIIICILFTIVMYIIMFINQLVCIIDETVLRIYNAIRGLCLKIWRFKICPFKAIMPKLDYLGCLSLAGGFGEDNTTFYPGCWCRGTGLKYANCGEDQNGNCNKSTDTARLMDSVQRSLALDYNIVKLDFYQDWVNGTLYMPLWYWRKRKKKTFLFGLFSSKAKSQYCSCDSIYTRLKAAVTCNIEYSDNKMNTNDGLMPDGEQRWHKRRSGTVSYKRGLIKAVENKDGLTAYYYVGMQPTSSNQNSSLQLGEMNNQPNVVLLYATDIILLGNLDPNNLYGIPQFYNCLPSTTANIPPIASVEENITDEDDSDSDSPVSVGEDSGTTVTTGMDWGHDYDDQTPKYQRGLFMDLSCTYANTKPKSCINVERLSEFGVNLDMSYDMQYPSGRSIKSGKIDADGFISKYELDDTENRAMFATLNHIGFLPQTYQDSKGSYATQVMDDNTNYFVNKFKYIYPTDFDGRLTAPMNNYKRGFEQAEADKNDDAYVTFRLGAESGSKSSNSEGRIRHFYKHISMPLYMNSYYFYFGVKKGSTAIDKFNQMFNASCYKNSTSPFTIDITKKGVSHCPSGYSGNNGYGYIKVVLDDITMPYSYTLTDSIGNDVASASGVTDEYFAIGGTLASATDDVIISKNDLSNQDYVLTVTDANGKTMTERVSLSVPSISLEYTTRNLGTKFYSKDTTSVNYICNSSNSYYGMVSISGMTVDGYEYTLSNASLITAPTAAADSYQFKLTAKKVDATNTTIPSTITSYMSVTAISRDGIDLTSDCMCNKKDSQSNVGEYSFTNGVLSLYVYSPSSFSVSVTQYCNNTPTDNISNDTVTIGNGSNFKAYLNDMPIKFMLGTTNGIPSSSNKFYSSTVVENLSSNNISGWFGVHDESSYSFDPTNTANSSNWEDFITLNDVITAKESKRSILKYKFDSIFSLSSAAYVTTNSSNKFRMDASGGIAPTLYRSLYPSYNDSSKVKDTYTLDDYGTAECSSTIPNIVGSNYYSGITSTSFNPMLSSNTSKQGNYFAAFTNDGGYTSSTAVSASATVVKIPSYTAVNPHGSVKRKGKDETGDLTKFKKAYTKDGNNYPYLRAMFLDRRFDYDFLILAPFVGTNFKLYSDAKKDALWKSSRISGQTYGGIEMAYDDDYNIISASTTSDGDSYSPISSIYEYTYAYDGDSNENVKTVLNKASDGNGITSGVFKRFYSSSINGVDLTNFYWSSFNRARLKELSTSLSSDDSMPHVFQYPYSNQTLYNGEFGKDNFTVTRYIDVGNIPQSTDISYDVSCCSYDITTNINEDGSISGVAKDGEYNEINLSFESPITFTSSNSDNKDDGNIEYNMTSTSLSDGYAKFSASTASLVFKYNTKATDEYDVYTKIPRIIKVLPKVDGTNSGGLTYYKTYTGSSIDTAIDKITITAFDKSTVSFWDSIRGNGPSVILPENVRLDEGYKTKYGRKSVSGKFFVDTEDEDNNTFLDSNDTKFSNITFSKKFELGGAKIFTILVDREYQYQTDDYLTRHIRTIETSDLYDCRDLVMRPLSEETVDGETTLYSYTYMQDYSEPSEDSSGGTSGSTSLNNVVLSQVMTFELMFSTSGDPSLMENQAFADSSSMSYTIKFITGNDNYYLTPSSTSTSTSEDGSKAYIRLTVNWTQEMGTTFDSRWKNDCRCMILAKTSSNFVYKINEFKLRTANTTKPIKADDKKKTTVSFIK